VDPPSGTWRSRALIEREPGNAEYLMELGYAHSNLGSLHEATGNLDEALESFRGYSRTAS
jgi:hypothetical protein